MNLRAVVLVLVPALACAGGDSSSSASAGFGLGPGQPVGWTTSTGEDQASTGSSSSGVEGESTGVPVPTTGGSSGEAVVSSSGGIDSTGGVDSTGGDCAGGCAAPGACEVGPGECIDGECVYAPAGAEVACDDADPCTEDDACDGAGGCAGVEIACERPHASGGSCQAGVCQGFACVAPWDNCNGDWDDGCEVPTGVANQCDANGLNPDGGCWTAYCGQSANPNATNFDGFFCSDCATCHSPGEGLVQWCDHSSGVWYPSAAGSCGNFEDLICAA